MSNIHYPMSEEIDVTINVKVLLRGMSDYHGLTPERLKEVVEDFKRELPKHLAGKLCCKDYYEEVVDGVDLVDYEVLVK